eukprot:6210738-Pleurochrysis_carterae.AAC.6
MARKTAAAHLVSRIGVRAPAKYARAQSPIANISHNRWLQQDHDEAGESAVACGPSALGFTHAYAFRVKGKCENRTVQTESKMIDNPEGYESVKRPLAHTAPYCS